MGDISRRLLIPVILIITVAGIVGILYYPLSNYITNTLISSTATASAQPKHIASISTYNDQHIETPMGVAAANESLYITDTGHSRVLIFTQFGTFKQAITIGSEAQGHPIDITIDTRNRVYVSVIGPHNEIVVFDSNGKFLYKFPEGVSQTAMAYATPGKAISLYAANNKLYITDILDQDIKVYSLDGVLLTRFGRPGNEKGEFLYPNGIIADKDGRIYVSDSNNGRVQVFNEKGEFLYMFTGPKKEPLALPRGITFDNQGRIQVADALRHKIYVFSKNGQFLFTYGSYGKQENDFAGPNDIAVNSITGYAFIADKVNNRISVWK